MEYCVSCHSHLCCNYTGCSICGGCKCDYLKPKNKVAANGCTECVFKNPSDTESCPHCGHDCELSAKTIRTDEDAHCDFCGKDSYMGLDGKLHQT